jgi:hypothetical protein
VGSLLANSMDEWKPLDIATSSEGSQPPLTPETSGLQADAATLQAEFESIPNHLTEVKQRHMEVLVTAGMLPETGLAEVHPERALEWVLNGINGRLNPDGLTIPLLGAQPDQVHLQTKTTEEGTVVQLSIEDGDALPLVRDLPLPAEAGEHLQASFIDGHLHLRW